MKEYKRIYKPFQRWEYREEIAWLNEQSRQGWQFVPKGVFTTHFVWDDSVVYRYQIDYQTKVNDLDRYLDAYREQGWELAAEYGKQMFIFRKVYDPALPESDYEIYTDWESLKAMLDKQKRQRLILAIPMLFLSVLSAVTLLRVRDMNMIARAVMYWTLTILNINEYLCLRSAARREPVRSWKKLDALAIIAFPLAMALFFVYYPGVNPELELKCSGSLEQTFEVRRPDWFRLYVRNAQGEYHAVVLDQDGKEIMRLETDDKRTQKFLMPGEYTVRGECLTQDGEMTVIVN